MAEGNRFDGNPVHYVQEILEIEDKDTASLQLKEKEWILLSVIEMTKEDLSYPLYILGKIPCELKYRMGSQALTLDID